MTSGTHERSAREAPSRHGLYVYAVTEEVDLDLSGSRLSDSDIPAGTVPRLIAGTGLALVVSDIALDTLQEVTAEEEVTEGGSLARLARRHDAVVRVAFEQTAVLPMRLGTVVADERAALDLLAGLDETARGLLSTVRGHREWGVRLRLASTTTGGGDSRPSRFSGATAGSGTEYLARRRAALTAAADRDRTRRAMVAATDEALSLLSTCGVRRAAGDTLLDAAYLVAMAREGNFLAEAQRRETKLGANGILLEITGPWPPYSFARPLREVGDG